MPGAATTGVYVRALFRRPLRWGAAALLLVAVGCSCSPDELFREDARLRAAAVEALDGRPGAVIVLDVGTGRVRAIAGEDTAVRWPFHPGSLVKLVTVWKGMEEGTLDPGYRFTCRGAALFSGTEYHCWYPPGHGDLDLVRGIAYSCNLYFLSLGDRMSPVDTYRGLAELGFGKKTGVNLPGEVSGSLAGPADGTDRRYLIGDTDAVTATPLQVITYLSALVNGGSVWVPVVTGTPDEIAVFRPRLARKIGVMRAAPVLVKGMRDAVTYGTAVKAAVEGHEVMGKTGTAGLPGAPWETHGWFLGFAPAESPRVAVLVFLYRGMGGPDAAPTAARVFRAYFDEETGP
jgi:cell division protein FtsI/penicillin-binding protein 2